MSTSTGALNVALEKIATRILPLLFGLMTAEEPWKSSSRSPSDGRMSILTVIGLPGVGGGVVGGGVTGGGVTGGGVTGGGGGPVGAAQAFAGNAASESNPPACRVSNGDPAVGVRLPSGAILKT